MTRDNIKSDGADPSDGIVPIEDTGLESRQASIRPEADDPPHHGVRPKEEKKDSRVSELELVLELRDSQVAALDKAIFSRDSQIADLCRTRADRDARIAALAFELNEREKEVRSLRGSKSWRFTLPFRLAGQSVRLAARTLQKALKKASALTAFLSFSASALRRWKDDPNRDTGIADLPGLALKARRYFSSRYVPGAGAPPPPGECPEVSLESSGDRTKNHLKARISRCIGALPRISVVMPVYNPPRQVFEEALESLRGQVYGNWELCAADDGSTEPWVRPFLEDLERDDPRVRVAYRESNGGISRATNFAAELATGEFLAFLDQDDLLSAEALGEVALWIAEHPATDVLYTDDDKVDMDGRRFAPQFKPDWSPELLLSYMYMGHMMAVRRDLFERLGGMREGFEGSQDYDFFIRATEPARSVGHIPRILYHWRAMPGSTAVSGGEKPLSLEAGRRAVQEAFDRRSIPCKVGQPAWAATDKIGIFNHSFPDDGPRVEIIIPTRNRHDMLRKCLDSLDQTTYRNFGVTVIDNESDDPRTLDYLRSCGHRVLRIPNPGGSFNFAHINNEAAGKTDADLLLFLNNDTEVKEPRWLSQMVGYSRIPGVGAVGARLLFPDGRVQHAGVIHGLYHGLAGPAFKLTPAGDNGYLSYSAVARNYSAVTAACMLTPRALFLEAGGFNAADFAVAFNDVDYCYRLVDRGLRCVYVPDAVLVHHEGASRSGKDDPREEAAFKRKYRRRKDPYYSPHLSLADERFRLSPRHIVLGDAAPVRVLMTAFNLNLEGAPFSQYEMTVNLRDRGYIIPVVFSPNDGPLRQYYEKSGIEILVARHPMSGIHINPAYDRAMDEFSMFIRSTGAEVVYGNTLQTFYAIEAAHRAGIPSVWNPRESEPWQSYFDFLGPEIAPRALECFAHPYRIVFVADATRDAFTPLDTRGNFAVVHNGLDIGRLLREAEPWSRDKARAKLGFGADDVVFLLLGTVCPRKGQQDLIAAISQMKPETRSRIRCLIVGDRHNDYSRELRSMRDALPEGLSERVDIVAETSDTALYYRAADVFVLTSRVESYPRVILEAMAFGLPIICTPVFGVTEQVRNGVNGLYYSPGAAAELARRIETLAEDRAMRARYSANSRLVLETLATLDEMVEQYGTIFREARFHERWGDENRAEKKPYPRACRPGADPDTGRLMAAATGSRILVGVDAADYSGASNEFFLSGWLIDARNPGDPDCMLGFSIGSEVFHLHEETRTSRDDVAGIFWFLEPPATCGFTLRGKLRSPSDQPFDEVSLVNIRNNQTVSDAPGFAISLSERYEAPDERLRSGVGDPNRGSFLMSGLTISRFLTEVYEQYGVKPLAACHVLDFGCACGRVARYMADRCMTIAGADHRQENIAWCRENLPGKYLPIELDGSAPFKDGSFDFIYGISVFTHLSARLQSKWLEELARVARPGAIVILSVLGPSAAARTGDPEIFKAFAASDGLLYTGSETRADGIAFHRNDHVQNTWSRSMEVLHILEAAVCGHQDLVVLRKR